MSDRAPRRVVNPAAATTDHAAREMGVKSQRDLERQREQQGRYLDDQRRRRFVVYTDTISFFREDIGDVGNADYTMRQATPSAVATWGSTTVDARMGAAGRVVGMRLWSSAARTAGTATGQVQITDNGVVTNYLLPDCVLDATTTQTAAMVVPFANGIPFSRGATLRAEVQTVSWAPTTADVAAEVLVAYEGMS